MVVFLKGLCITVGFLLLSKVFYMYLIILVLISLAFHVLETRV